MSHFPPTQHHTAFKNVILFDCSQMMATAREAWQFTPNVISHFEKEAEHFLLEDKRRKEKLRQLKVGHFL